MDVGSRDVGSIEVIGTTYKPFVASLYSNVLMFLFNPVTFPCSLIIIIIIIIIIMIIKYIGNTYV